MRNAYTALKLRAREFKEMRTELDIARTSHRGPEGAGSGLDRDPKRRASPHRLRLDVGRARGADVGAHSWVAGARYDGPVRAERRISAARSPVSCRIERTPPSGRCTSAQPAPVKHVLLAYSSWAYENSQGARTLATHTAQPTCARCGGATLGSRGSYVRQGQFSHATHHVRYA